VSRTPHEKTPQGAGFFSAWLTRRRPSATERATTLPWTQRAFLRLVDAQRAAVHLEAVQGLDRGLRFVLGHVDETEAARLAGLPVVDELDGLHLAVALEQGLHVLLGGIEGQIAYVNRRHWEVSLIKERTAASRTRRSHVPREQSNRSRLQG